MQALRICFAGTPDFAAAHLAALLQSQHSIVAVFTQPDRAAGRGNKLQASAVKQLALQHGLPVYQPVSLKPAEQQDLLAGLKPDLLIVVAYGLILPQGILDVPRFGCINVHASLLPRWRGAAPIERALLAGDKVTGVTIIQMDAGLDTGDMLTTETVSIEATDTSIDLENKLISAGTKALLRTLDDLPKLVSAAKKQDDSAATYAAKLTKFDSVIDWQQDAEAVNRQVRACAGRSPAYSLFDGQRVRILAATAIAETVNVRPGTILAVDKTQFKVACVNSELAVTRIQLPGKRVMAIGEVLNSRPDFFQPGSVLSANESSA